MARSDDRRSRVLRRRSVLPDDERDRLQPKMGRRARLASASPALAGLVLRGHGHHAGAAGKVGALPAGIGPGRHARRVVIQVHVQRMTRSGAKAAAMHVDYIERDGAEKDGGPSVLYGPDGPVGRDRFKEPRDGEEHPFRFIVSPEDGAELDLHDYVRRLMDKIGRDVGRPLEWAAANHHDTGKPHAHVVVRGVDLDGCRLRFSRQYISHGMRWTAQELATELLGPRLESEIRRAREREITQERFTSLDRELERAAKDGGHVDLGALRRQSRDDTEAQHLLDRLEHLERLGVARPVSRGAWQLAEGWQKDLRALGEHGDIIKQVHRAMRGGDPGRFHPVRPGQGLPDGRGGVDERELVARIAGKGLEDEAKAIWYAVLETPDGAAYHVRLSDRDAEARRTGDLVTFRTRREAAVRPVDRHIAEVAARQGGVYAVAGDLEREGAARAAPARLRELAARGLIAAKGPAMWAVPIDFLEQLERRPQPPRYRLSVHPLARSLDAQVGHPGPVWLDTLNPNGLATRGFGAEVARALERRREVVRELGIAPDDPARGAKLLELGRRTVGRDIERRTGKTFLETFPHHFRGRLEHAPDGAAYVVISDGTRFVVLPSTPQLRANAGDALEVSCAADGRVTVRQDPAVLAERQELARRAAGESHARATSRTFLPTVPPGFRGRVQQGPDGSHYFAVSDGSRFILIPDSPEARALSGTTVDVARDNHGRFAGVRPHDRDRDLGR